MFKIEQKQFEQQKKSIRKILEISERSQYYSEIYKKNNICISAINCYEDFCKIPILTKSDLNENKFDMVTRQSSKMDRNTYDALADDFLSKKEYLLNNGFYLKITSGSTGMPVEILKSKDDLRREYIGLNFGRRKYVDLRTMGAYVWIWPANRFVRKVFYNDTTSHVYAENGYGYKYMMEEYSDESFEELTYFIIAHDIRWITAPPSMLYYYASFLDQKRIHLPLRYIECHSEKLYSWQEENIERVFGVKPVSVYSSNEIQFMGISSGDEAMQILTSNVFIELLPTETNRYRVIATSLACYDLPIIRYDLGDCAKYTDHDMDTPYIMLEGYRNNDYLVTANGKKYEPFVLCDLIMLLKAKFNVEIAEYVIYQNDYCNLTFYFQDKILSFIVAMPNFKRFIIDYLREVTSITYDIAFGDICSLRKERGVMKHKYFMVGNFNAD